MLQLPVFSVMEEKVTRELEHVSKIVLAQPQLVTPEQRHEAENVILQFRKTKLPYNICRYILENSKCDYVLFQAATTIKEGVVREWSLLSSDDIESLRSFLLRYITNHVSLQSYVREQILQTVAVILKRGTLDSKGADRDTLFTDITHLVSSGNVTMQLVACSMLTALLNEYSSSARTSNVGLTWEFHTKCKSTFEESDLKRVLLFALQVLNELEKQPSPLPREAMAVMNRMLSISEQVLSWEFTKKSGPRRFVGNFEMNPNVPLMPNDKWRNTLLDKSVIHLFFRIHRKVRHNQEMASHSLQCLTQLASLNGPVFPDDKARTEYLATYVDCFLQLLSCIDLQDYENLAVANIFKNIIMLFPMTCIVGLPGVLFDLMLQQLTHLTCSIGKAASMEEAMHKDDTIYMESYEKLLEAWMELVTGMKDIAPDKLKPHAQQVFNTYIQCHVSAPDGCRTQESVEAFDEIDEVEEDDRDRFCDQLCSIGILGRMVPDHSVPSLCRVLEDRVNKLNHHLQHLQHNYSISGADLSVDQYLTTLYEDLHWIILMIAFLLTEESEGETPMIPSDIMSYSISQAGSIDLHTTLKLLGSPSESIDCIENAEYSSDSVVRLVSAVFRLCEVERKASETKLSEILSPQVGQSVMWFLKRWVVAYLLPDENYYSQVSQALLAAFGRDSDGAQWTVSFLLSKVLNNLAIWSSEDALTIDTLYLFCALLENRARAKYVTKCQLLWDLAQQQSEHKPPLSLMSHDAKRLLMKGLVVAGSGVEETVREDYWKCVLSSLQLRFFETVRDENMSKVGYQTKVKGLLLDYFECLCGVAQGSRIDNQEQLFNYFVPILADTIKVLDVYHDSEDVVQIILDLYSEVAQAQLCYLSMSNSRKFYELCLSTIQVYSKHNIGKKCRNASEEEENRYNDILLVIELLTHLLSKDYIDFSDPEESPVGETIEAVDVILYGLNIVIPLMTAELLTFPALCSQYFKLIALLAELHAEKFTCLPESLFHTLVTSMDLGLTSFGAEECNLCLESITALASHVYMDNQTSTPLHAAMPHFLKCVFKIMFKETFNMSFIETASAALFCLICCEQDHYRHLVNELLHSQTEPEYKQRLLEAFNNLTPPSLNLNISRQSKITFLQNFDEFLVNVRGFLCVK